MAKFDMGAAWEDSLVLLKSHNALTGTVAAVFFFLPALAISWFGPAPIKPAEGATFEQTITALQANLLQALPYQLAVAIFAIVGSLAILRLWLSRSATSVGEALGFGVRLLPTMIALQIVTGVMLGLGFLLLIIPGLYLIGRLALVSPTIADRGIVNPIDAIAESWRLTRDNGWAIFFFLFLVMLVVFIVMMVVGAIVGPGAGAGVGHIVSGFLNAG
ncbi:MAG: glycerophosphoryl diester phosphodiesterase membrane domain-containing protein, partial [Sphingopyxis sp.]|nr:glycerophosphoryl diester phosphodiesterase membrane domain-containing protein [Sphingopyxis sp.]